VNKSELQQFINEIGAEAALLVAMKRENGCKKKK